LLQQIDQTLLHK